MKTTTKELEAMAIDLAEKTGCSIEEARAAMRVEMIRIAVAFGSITIDEANAKLAEVGLQLRKVS